MLPCRHKQTSVRVHLLEALLLSVGLDCRALVRFFLGGVLLVRPDHGLLLGLLPWDFGQFVFWL